MSSKSMLQFSQAAVKVAFTSQTKPKRKGNIMKATLTQRQAQYLITRLSIVAQAEQDYRSQMRTLEGLAWATADKDQPYGVQSFDNLNRIRDNIRASKSEEAKLNDVIRSLRKVR